MNAELRKQLEDSLLDVQDLDNLSIMTSIFVHAAERCATIMELDAEKRMLLSKGYMMYQLKRGDEAEKTVKKAMEKISFKRSELGDIINRVKAFKNVMDKYTVRILHNNDRNFDKGLKDLMDDVKFLCKLYAIMGNCEENDLINIESTANILAKKKRISEKLISSF